MIYALVVGERAQMQIEKAANWFFDQTPGLEVKFLIQLNSAMIYIQNTR
jgi:hypothetical protein